MAVLLGKIKNAYEFLFYDYADDRSKDIQFPAPWVLFVVMPFYMYFSLGFGQRLMQDYKPFKLKRVMFYYNIIQIILCAYTFILALKGGWLGHYNFRCQPVDRTENPQTRAMLNAFWLYTILKFVDLFDTLFFVLRKKDRQISTLHVFHHTVMPCASVFCLRYYPNGHATFVGLLNSVVHVIMYTYYLIAGLGPKYQKYLWWKRHLTTMQIVQFSLAFIHSVAALTDSSCEYPRWVCWVVGSHSLIFMYMFGNFYYVNYIKPHKQLTRDFKEISNKDQ